MATKGVSEDNSGCDLEAVQHRESSVGVTRHRVVAAVWKERTRWGIGRCAMAREIESNDSVR